MKGIPTVPKMKITDHNKPRNSPVYNLTNLLIYYLKILNRNILYQWRQITKLLCRFWKQQKRKIYQNFSGIFRKRKKLAFKHLQFQTQMNIIEDAPKEKKTFYFSILPEEYRTKETLSKIENIDYKTVEKYLSNKKKEFKKEDKKKDENKTNIGISKEAFKERLKLFDTKK